MLLIAVIFLFAGFLQGITSFGFSLVALPLLAFILDIKLIVPVLIIYSLIINTTILIHLWRNIELKEIMWIVVTGIIFTPIGMSILLYIDSESLKMITGILIFIVAVLLFMNKKIVIKNERIEHLFTGALSGILNGSLSFSGPPLIIFLTNKGVEKQKFRASLTFYFWILNAVTIPIFILGGLITIEVWVFSLKYVVFLIIGVTIGIFLGNKLDEKIFKKFVIIILMVLGIFSCVSSLNI